MSSQSPLPRSELEEDYLIQLTDNLGKVTISGSSTRPRNNCQPSNSSQPNNTSQRGNTSRRDYSAQTWNTNPQDRPQYAPKEWIITSTPADLRINNNGFPSCYGFSTTKGNEPCKRDGKNKVLVGAHFEYYCYQHDPRNQSKRCHGKKKGNKRCENICSDSELRAGGLPICN
ncbi:hypothetical protein BGZ76_000269, partial [Entomortierella beljakovae]